MQEGCIFRAVAAAAAAAAAASRLAAVALVAVAAGLWVCPARLERIAPLRFGRDTGIVAAALVLLVLDDRVVFSGRRQFRGVHPFTVGLGGHLAASHERAVFKLRRRGDISADSDGTTGGLGGDGELATATH